jgi:hypothetical protein
MARYVVIGTAHVKFETEVDAESEVAAKYVAETEVADGVDVHVLGCTVLGVEVAPREARLKEGS